MALDRFLKINDFRIDMDSIKLVSESSEYYVIEMDNTTKITFEKSQLSQGQIDGMSTLINVDMVNRTI